MPLSEKEVLKRPFTPFDSTMRLRGQEVKLSGLDCVSIALDCRHGKWAWGAFEPCAKKGAETKRGVRQRV